ncbi:GtrA family protein [Devosia sediminis]|uniref:GtrA family protein n=1 Tax=Devosia sediminis TaxID=2798801 RepID=A0A934MJP6_9HYPH|nr:GtrA family protein [Devosia sediminis]MBJ3783300.1 GtrA family protein [Devosia sediminis]
MSTALESLMRDPPPSDAGRRQGGGIASFVLIGGGAAVGFVVLSSVLIGMLSDTEAWIVSAICYASFILPVYLLHRRFTFASEAAHWQALPRYVVVQVMALLLASIFGFVFHGTLALPSLPAAVLVTALTSGVNFLVLKSWAFAFERPYEAATA